MTLSSAAETLDGTMTGPARKWEERRRILESRKPEVRIDGAVVRRGAKGEYHVVIEGLGFLPAAMPPEVTVGGVPLEQLEFARDGRTITGVLRSGPQNQQIAVDLGYASAEGNAPIEPADDRGSGDAR
jgi:hypothetical protein